MPVSPTSDLDEHPPPAGRPRLRRIAAVVNPASGGVGPDAAEGIAELVAEHGYALSLTTPQPDEIEAAVRAAVGADPDLVLILAGDGTARLAAELAGPDGPLVAPLPGGTLNMLPHALYGPGPWREALAATLTEGMERSVCGGRVCGQVFFVAAILGAPALWGHAREAVRAGDFREAARRASFALRRAFTGRIRYTLDDRPSRAAEALVLITPTVSKALDEDIGLEAAALDLHDAREAFRLAFNGLAGDWRRDPGVTVELCAKGVAAVHHGIPAILDGEVQRLPHRAEFEFVRRAFRALTPPLVPAARP
jgi:diacylglycerol kinase family enzyme